MKKSKIIIWGVFLISTLMGLVPDGAMAQNGIEDIGAAFTQYRENTLQEKLYVQTDKDFYISGEVLWFKIFDQDASTNRPLGISKVSYVELVDTTGKSVLRAKIGMNRSQGDGSFYLPAGLPSGMYQLRAFTNWMKNFSSDFFFKKNITIVNTQVALPNHAQDFRTQYDLQFFPEGGNLVEQIPGTVAFKLTDQFGKGLDFKGQLVDGQDTLLNFLPLHDGMGRFDFTPQPGHLYKAIVTTPSGGQIEKELPPAYSSGYVMHVTDLGAELSVQVRNHPRTNGDVYLLVQTRGAIKSIQNGVLQLGQTDFHIEKSLLGDGISQITLFDIHKEPVCERLYCKVPSHLLSLNAHTPESIYGSRKPVQLTINAGSAGEDWDTASLCLSVYRIDSLQGKDPMDITSYLYLNSDLKGYIENPSYYFTSKDSSATKALDNLMLTNGWRRFVWKDVLNHTRPTISFPPEYNGMLVSGKVTSTLSDKPAKGVECFLGIPGLESAFNSSLSDNSGHIIFEEKGIYGAQTLVVTPNILKDSTCRIDLIDPFKVSYSRAFMPQFNLLPSQADALSTYSISMQVENVYSGRKIQNFAVSSEEELPFYGKPDARYLLDDYTRFTTMEEILREYVILADVHKREGDFHYSLFDYARSAMMKTDPMVLLDGVPVFNFNKLMQVDPLLLNRLDVVNRLYFLGNSVFSGILSWSSYKGDMAGFELNPHATVLDFDGLQRHREFYSPAYATEGEIESHIPDFRNVLLWSPNIKIAKGSSKAIGFYTSDLPGTYIAEVEGITSSGQPGSTLFTFQVKN